MFGLSDGHETKQQTDESDLSRSVEFHSIHICVPYSEHNQAHNIQNIQLNYTTTDTDTASIPFENHVQNIFRKRESVAP